MPPKRGAPAAKPAVGKKPSSGTKPNPSSGKVKAKSSSGSRPSVTDNIAETIQHAAASAQHTASDIAQTVGKAIDVAGDLLIDGDDATPVDVTEAAGEVGVDIPKLKKQGKAAAKAATRKAEEQAKVAEKKVEEKAKPLRGKAAKAAKDAEEAVEDIIEGTTGVDVKAAKGKAAKKASDAAAIVQPQVDKVVSAAQPAIESAVASVKDAATNPRKRKKAEDFMATAEQTVKKVVSGVAGKVGEVLESAIKDFGEASGLAADLSTETKEKGKKAVKGAKQALKETGKRKAKAVAETADEIAAPVTKKGKTAAKDAAAAAEPVVEKGKRAAKVAADTAQASTKKAGKIAKAAADAAVEAAQEEDEDEDDESFIHGFSSSDGGADSSDDESDAEDVAIREAGKKIDMGSLPMVAKDDKTVQARLKKAQRKKDTERGTLYIGRIPHGFYEDQMKEYFSQFGDVTRLRLARNRKTGASKHYAYVEMSSQSVAEIVAETMNNYLMMGHLLKCEVVPSDEVHPQLWVGANKKFRKIPRARVEKMKHDKPRTKQEQEQANKRVLEKQAGRRKKIKDAGIDYDFEGHK
ncbi:Uncharacterized RNA-binding protein [Saitozyma sp. JCM 24511]|nr:Uncharacterized RNA-binding protein [Saitozyma sp. JCM 24511]